MSRELGACHLATKEGLNNGRNFSNAQYTWVTNVLRSAGAPQNLLDRIAQERMPESNGQIVDTLLGGALSVGLRDGTFMKGSLMDNLEYGNFSPAHRLASEVTRRVYNATGDDVLAVTKGVEAFEAAKAVNYDGTVSQGPSADLSPEDFQTAAQNQAQLARNTQVLKDRRAANLLRQVLSLSVSPLPTEVNSVTIRGVPKDAKISAGTSNKPAPQTKRTVDFAKIARALNGRPRSLLDTKTVEAKNYAGPSQEYSAEDFQSASQNRAQLSTQTEIKSAMNTPAYRESAHPDFQKTRKEIADAWAGYTARREQTKRDQAKQDANDLQGQTPPTSKATDKGGDAPLSNKPPSKQDTLGQKDVLGEVTGRAKATEGFLGNDPTQPSDINRVMDRMAAGQRAKVEREKNLSWQDRSWSTMSSYDRSRTIAADKSRRRGEARSKNAHTPRGKNAYGEETTGGIGSLGRGGQLSSVGEQKANPNQKNRAANKDGSYTLDAEGNGAGNAGGTVICTELYHQSLLPLDIYMADQRYGLWIEKNDPYVMIGYHFLAKPVVRLMQNSKLFTRILFKTVAEPWAKEMVVKAGNNGIGSVRGKILFAVGLPVCRVIGRGLVACRKQEPKIA